MRSARGLSSAVLTMEALLVVLGALTAQFGDEATVDNRWLWGGLSAVLFLYVITAGQRDSVRLRMLGWVAQAATMAYAISLGGFLPYLCAAFVVFWFYTAKAIRLMSQATGVHQASADADATSVRSDSESGSQSVGPAETATDDASDQAPRSDLREGL